MAYKYNPLLVGKLDRVGAGASRLSELDDVNTAGTVNGKVLTYQSGTWLPEAAAGAGDMLKAEYVTGSGTVYNASRLEGDTLATVQAHTVDASKITTGTFGLARIPAMDDARIPDLETLSYGAAFATAQVPAVGAYKITSGTFNANRIPILPTARITSGTFNAARIPDVGVVAINYVIDGGGAAIAAGTVGFLEVPFACHVDRWTLVAEQHGSVVVDIWRDAYSNYPPTDADSMPGTTNMPAISGTVAAQGTDLTGWGTQGIASGDVLVYHVDSCVSIELCTIALRVQKT